jgi:hypothetical protein
MIMEVKTALRLSILALFILGGSIDARRSQAQTDPPLGTETTSINKVSSEFSSFLGDDAAAVVTGLRNGTPISLTTTETTQSATLQTTTTTINPPTGKMGLGNVRISLALAEAQLIQNNINQPTSDQLSAALLGGSLTTVSGTTATTTQMQGILTMRSEGMGWGQIAHELGYKLGPVISGRQTFVVAPTAEGGVVDADGQTASTKGGVVTGSGKTAGKSGIVTGSGKTAGKSGIVTGSGKTSGKSSFVGTRGRGAIVTGSGQSLGHSGGITTGNSRGHGHGIVSGSGGSVGKGGGFSGGGHGRGKVK